MSRFVGHPSIIHHPLSTSHNPHSTIPTRKPRYTSPMRRSSIAAALALIALFLPSQLLAWGTKEHLQLTRLAAARLIADENTPPAMKQWLKDATPGLMDIEAEKKWFLEGRQGIVPRGADGIAYWAVVPDVVVLMDTRNEKVEPFGVPERLLHYIDLELFLTGDQKREYRHDLSAKPALDQIPRDMADPRYQQAGMLPFRVADAYAKLVEHLRAGRLTDQPNPIHAPGSARRARRQMGRLSRPLRPGQYPAAPRDARLQERYLLRRQARSAQRPRRHGISHGRRRCR